MRVGRLDSISLDKTYYTEEGYFVDHPIVTTCGIFEYKNTDGSTRRELRLPEYVFDEKSLQSYKGKPIIITHDAGEVNKDNVHREQIGTIMSEGYRDGDSVRSEIIIHDTNALKRCGLKELSLGYSLDTEDIPGIWQGEPYDCIQKNIEINHLALVGEARAGETARLNMDSKDEDYIKGGRVIMYNPDKKGYRADDGEELSPEELEAAITPKTKLLVLPFPNNPTGAIMERKDLEAIAEVILKHDLFVLSDEIYSELTYTENHVSICNLPGMKERTVLINGFSKSHSMTGWRLGYACGPEVIIKQMLKIHQFAIMCAPTTSQYAAVEAMRNGDEDVQMMKAEYNVRRKYLLKRFAEMGVDCFEALGAFYVFPCIKEFGMTSEDFATGMLKSKKVCVVPGTAFGDCGEGFLRISYAYSMENLKIAMDRFEEFVKELRENK